MISLKPNETKDLVNPLYFPELSNSIAGLALHAGIALPLVLHVVLKQKT